MIRRLNEEDHAICFALLKTRAAENLFIIGDIEVYGYEQPFQKLWGEFDEAGTLRAVLLKYKENYIPFAPGAFDAAGFANIIMEDPDFKMLSGIKDITAVIAPHIQKEMKRKQEMYYAKCTQLTMQEAVDVSHVQRACLEDVEELVTLLRAIPEFDHSLNITVERKRQSLKKGTARSLFIREDGKMVATASTTAENSLSAMVVAVATLADYKRKGYATACVFQICNELLREGKELCLLYNNPAAGSIYKRIGFEDIGFWTMYTYETC